MIESYRADAIGRFGALLNRAPTPAELSAVTDAWPRLGQNALDAMIRAYGAAPAPAPALPAPAAAEPARSSLLWIVAIVLVVAVIVFKKLRRK